MIMLTNSCRNVNSKVDMKLTEDFIRNLPVMTEQEEKDAEYVEAHFEEDLIVMLDEFKRAVEEIDRQYDK